jgi:hypothetical protein
MTDQLKAYNALSKAKKEKKTACKKSWSFKKTEETSECTDAKQKLTEAQEKYDKLHPNTKQQRQGGGALQSKISSRRKLKF